MIRQILLCVDGSEYSQTATDYALQIATKMSAGIKALHILDLRLLEGPYMADIGGSLGAQPYMALVPQIQAIMNDRAEVVMNAVRTRAASVPVELTCETVSGLLVPTILEAEKNCDLVVIGKRGEHGPYESDLIGPSVEWIVRRSVKPCLVTPWRVREIERVAAAFDGSEHARKAISGALDMVLAHNLPLSVVTVVPIGESTPHWQQVLDDGLALVRARGVEPTGFLLHGYPDEQILQFVNDSEVDLLVIGAYGHTRVREFLLGSTTFQILLGADIPVYLIR